MTDCMIQLNDGIGLIFTTGGPAAAFAFGRAREEWYKHGP